VKIPDIMNESIQNYKYFCLDKHSRGMRKIFAVIMVLSLVMASSCREKLVPVEPEKPEKEEQTPTPEPDEGEEEKEPVVEPEPDVLMVFNVSAITPSSVNNDDIALLDELHYALYSNEVENISYVLNEEAQPIVRDVISISDGVAKLEASLAAGAAGHEYVLILWAQKSREEGQEFYDLKDLRNINCAGDMVLCNQEERVAYYLTHKFTVAGPEHSEDLTLVRPHARLNLGTFAQSLRRPDGSTLRLDQSSISLTGVSTSFNTIAGLDKPQASSYGKAGQTTSEKYTFQMNDVPQKAIIINEIEYPYLALNYFFVADRVDLDFEIIGTPMAPESGEQQLSNEAPEDETSEDETPEDDQPRQAIFHGSLYGVNAHQGYTTTLIGHFFGADGRYEYDFRLQIGEDSKGGVTIIGDEDGDGQYDEPMDWGWALGGDDTPSGGGIGGGDYEDPEHGEGDDDDDDHQGDKDEEQKEDVRIEGPDAVTWEVYTVEGLLMWAEEVRQSTTSLRINLKLFADIYLEEPWVPLVYKYGTIDGQGHTIHNMTIEGTSNLGFLVCIAKYSEVGNLNFDNVNISGTSNLGVVAAKIDGSGYGIISNCHVLSGSVSGASGVGGILGNSGDTYYTKIYDCSNNASISGTENVGGIAGKTYSDTISRCTNRGTVTGSGKYVGGICGYYYFAILYDSVNYGDVSGQNYTGGICGWCDGCTSCINYGKISGTDYVGGISGHEDGYGQKNSTNCSNYGSVMGNKNVGGLFGEFKTFIESMSNYGSVKGVSNVGGLCGRTIIKNFSFFQCINDADVEGVDKVGGILGYFDPIRDYYTLTFSNNNISGTIKGATNVDQLVGLSDGVITDDGTNIFSGEVVIVEAE
jgi:hypothetical protein